MTSVLRDAAPAILALADPVRVGLVERLGERGPASLARLAADTTITRQAIARHLGTLESAGLVASERRGRERIWQLRPEALEATGRALVDASRRWDDALERLRRYVED
ncbi:ArsR/SmtB family transcription factor [Parafrigoribacterium soli]|uniref:ArsR/SmtB family transcription factor n=1 Tax=Parafrigoribacterium soli TaxID=3144663 RepID=UPI0032EBD960